MKYNGYSRFRRTPVTIFSDRETVEHWEKPEFLTVELSESAVNTFVVTANYNGRPDLLSQLLYGSPYYDWVLIAYNNVTDTLNWPPTGLQMKYPVSSMVITGVSG
jgi:hypothetical protein